MYIVYNNFTQSSLVLYGIKEETDTIKTSHNRKKVFMKTIAYILFQLRNKRNNRKINVKNKQIG
jgi:hypothetical protein